MHHNYLAIINTFKHALAVCVPMYSGEKMKLLALLYVKDKCYHFRKLFKEIVSKGIDCLQNA